LTLHAGYGISMPAIFICITPFGRCRFGSGMTREQTLRSFYADTALRSPARAVPEPSRLSFTGIISTIQQ
jgi:hypothetical protein